MPNNYLPAVFVSSTCFDLQQIRANIRDFISSLGLDPVLSEHNSFPVSPDQDTISNCLQNVREKADIFILIIGSRHGYDTGNGKSITNLEYLEAKRKGIPIYIFVNSKVMDIIPLWKNNPEADYSSHVEDVKVLSFADNISNYESNWVYKFNTSDDIKSALMKQIPYLFSVALEYRKKIIANDFKLPGNKFPPVAAKIVIEKNDGWEYLLFAELCKSYIGDLKHHKFDLEYGVSFNKVASIDKIDDFITWAVSHSIEIAKLIEIAEILINRAAKKSFGKPGVEGDYQEIQYVSQRFIEVYEKIINWKLSFSTLKTKEEFKPILTTLSGFADDPLLKIEKLVHDMHAELSSANHHNSIDGNQKTISFSLILAPPDIDEFNKRLGNLMSSKLKRNTR